MKKTMLIGLALGFVAVTATASFAGIEGSKHDLSDTGASAALGLDSQDRICVYCHHPHNTVKASNVQSTFKYSPLWNRDIPASSDFTAYNNSTAANNMMGNSTTAKHTMNGGVEVGGVSLLCMSCHDGVTAMNAYSANNPGGATGSTGTIGSDGNDIITGVASFGMDLSNHHPIGMVWAEVVNGDNEIHATTATFRGTTITIGSVLTGGVMECSSCHDVHNSTPAERNNAERFLWTSNNGSEFCLSCHNK